MKHIKLRTLTAADATLIGKAETSIYRGDNSVLINGMEDFRKDLEQAIDGNFSAGAFDRLDNNLIGYIICYCQQSLFYSDRVAYISDFGVIPAWQTTAHKKLLINSPAQRMFTWVISRTRKLFLPLEGEARLGSYLLVKRHSEYFAANGYRLTEEQFLRKFNGGENFYRFRMEPIA